MTKKPTFSHLIKSITQIHEQMAGQATKAINISLTLRNWKLDSISTITNNMELTEQGMEQIYLNRFLRSWKN